MLKLAASCCAFMALLVAVPLFVHAHATPLTYEPAAGSTSLETPASITIRFTERIEMGASSLTVYAPDGSKVNQGKGEFSAGDSRILAVPITDSGEGVYTVSWQVVSVDDGHFTKGAYSFLVDKEGAAFEGDAGGSTEVSYSSQLPDAILGFFNLVGESIFLAVLVLLFMFRGDRFRSISADIRTNIMHLFTHAVTIGCILFVASGAISIFLKSAELASLQSTALSEAVFTYLASSVGTFAALKLLLITAFFLVWVFARSKDATLSVRIMFILGLLLSAVLIMQAYISHATASLFLPEFGIFVTLIHLVAKEFIVGGLILLTALFVVCIGSNRSLYQRVALQFDVYVAWSLFLAGLSGAYITWLHLKDFTNIEATVWGERFVLLLIAAMLLGVFRLFHQLWVHPRLEEVRMHNILQVTLLVECALGLLVLFFSSYSAITTPPFTVEAYTFSQETISEGLFIELAVHPYEQEMFLITFTDEQTGVPVDPQSLTVTATNNEIGIGPNVLQSEPRFKGGYVVPHAELVPHGEWEVSVIAGQEDRYDASLSAAISYPDDITQSMRSDEYRTLNSFAYVMMISALMLVLLSTALIVYSYRSISRLHFKDEFSSPLSLKRMLTGVALTGLILCSFYAGWQVWGKSNFQKKCIADTHAWVQTFPTREFEATSPNAIVGCLVHDGHYHFADEREYEYFIKNHAGDLRN